MVVFDRNVDVSYVGNEHEVFDAAWRIGELTGGACNRQMDGDRIKHDLRIIHNYSDSQEIKNSIYQLSQHLFCKKDLHTEELNPLRDYLYGLVVSTTGTSPMKDRSEKSIYIR